ncbi:hypothetical protein MRX96_028603 [Rhipicephalus microplus]
MVDGGGGQSPYSGDSAANKLCPLEPETSPERVRRHHDNPNLVFAPISPPIASPPNVTPGFADAIGTARHTPNVNRPPPHRCDVLRWNNWYNATPLCSLPSAQSCDDSDGGSG